MTRKPADEPQPKKEAASAKTSAATEREPYRLRLPGFVSDEEVGAGELVKRVTNYLHIRPCAGCEGRARWLNRRLVITGRRSR
jgi:hypothetical protein